MASKTRVRKKPATLDLSGPQPAKKPRGRPRKRPISNVSVVSEEDDDDDEEDESDFSSSPESSEFGIVQKPVPPKKGPGRPTNASRRAAGKLPPFTPSTPTGAAMSPEPDLKNGIRFFNEKGNKWPPIAAPKRPKYERNHRPSYNSTSTEKFFSSLGIDSETYEESFIVHPSDESIYQSSDNDEENYNNSSNPTVGFPDSTNSRNARDSRNRSKKDSGLASKSKNINTTGLYPVGSINYVPPSNFRLKANPTRFKETRSCGLTYNFPLGLGNSSRSANKPQRLEKSRIFDLEEAPTFYPSQKEFDAGLTEYLATISQDSRIERCGICKIVPPKSWRPQFCIDQETFRFNSRLQRINSLEASSRVKLNYLEKLQRYNNQNFGDSRLSLPLIQGRKIDLYDMRREVEKAGGYHEDPDSEFWLNIAANMRFQSSQTVGRALHSAYSKAILPFEKFEAQIALTKDLSSDDIRLNPSETDCLKQGEDANFVDTSSVPTLLTSHVHPSPQNSSKQNAVAQNMLKENPVKAGEVCEICTKSTYPRKILLRDGCDKGYHVYCLDPPLSSIPDSEWYCNRCLLGTGGDYGFEEGESHSLLSFKERADEFACRWFEKRYPRQPAEPAKAEGVFQSRPDYSKMSEDDIEREFWRLVGSQDETVDVEYGADIHSSTHGNAMPSLERQPQDPDSLHGFNLNNIPISHGSLLRYIKSDVSGMTIPWMYIGMLFATFCWHNEDHYTHSINYSQYEFSSKFHVVDVIPVHFGHTKTWYGVPGNAAELFEKAIRKDGADLFEQQPDFLS